MIQAEDDQRKHRHPTHAITQADLDARDKEGLCNPLSVDIYFTWKAFGGGMGASLSLSEIMTMPTWLRKDFRYIRRIEYEIRQDREASVLWFAEQQKDLS